MESESLKAVSLLRGMRSAAKTDETYYSNVNNLLFSTAMMGNLSFLVELLIRTKSIGLSDNQRKKYLVICAENYDGSLTTSEVIICINKAYPKTFDSVSGDISDLGYKILQYGNDTLTLAFKQNQRTAMALRSIVHVDSNRTVNSFIEERFK